MNLFDQIIAKTYTLVDLARRVQLIKGYLNDKIFAKRQELPKDAQTQDRDFLSSLDLSEITKDNVAQNVEKLEEQVKNTKPLVLFLPFTLPENELENVVKKLRSDYGSDFLVEVRLDPQLIAGAALAYKGVYKDYSLRQTLRDNHDALVANFKKYMG